MEQIKNIEIQISALKVLANYVVHITSLIKFETNFITSYKIILAFEMNSLVQQRGIHGTCCPHLVIHARIGRVTIRECLPKQHSKAPYVTQSGVLEIVQSLGRSPLYRDLFHI